MDEQGQRSGKAFGGDGMSGSPVSGLRWWQHVLLAPVYIVLVIVLIAGRCKQALRRNPR